MYFDDVELYLNPLKLNGNEQADVKKDAYVKGNLVAVINCLSIWRDHKPSEATFRALIKILLDLGKEEIATKICQYLKEKVYFLLYYTVQCHTKSTENYFCIRTHALLFTHRLVHVVTVKSILKELINQKSDMRGPCRRKGSNTH